VLPIKQYRPGFMGSSEQAGKLDTSAWAQSQQTMPADPKHRHQELSSTERPSEGGASVSKDLA
jgi:hypothetical protein